MSAALSYLLITCPIYENPPRCLLFLFALHYMPIIPFHGISLCCQTIADKKQRTCLTTLCPKKNIPDIIDCNLKTTYQILIIFGTDISDTTCHQMTI